MLQQQIILEVATSVRKKMVRVAKDEGFSTDLCGLCLRASTVLHKALSRAGVKSKLIMGEYGGLEHCWVTVEGTIVDITGTQFGLKAILIAEPGSNAASKYFQQLTGKKLRDRAALWPIDQRPQGTDKKLVDNSSPND